jgi:hypothetical protein
MSRVGTVNLGPFSYEGRIEKVIANLEFSGEKGSGKSPIKIFQHEDGFLYAGSLHLAYGVIIHHDKNRTVMDCVQYHDILIPNHFHEQHESVEVNSGILRVALLDKNGYGVESSRFLMVEGSKYEIGPFRAHEALSIGECRYVLEYNPGLVLVKDGRIWQT